MRFREIKPILREFVDAGTSTNVSSLDDIKDLVVDNPEVATEVNQILKDIMARMPSSKQQAQEPQQQTQEPQQNQVQQTTQPKVERPNIRQPNSAPVQNTQNKTQDLPPGSPVQEQLAGQEAQPAQSANATRSKISVDQALLTIDDFGEELADYTPEQQAKILALVNKKINEKVAPKIELAKKQGGEEKEKEIITRTKEFKEIAKKLARDKGMNDDWGLKIYGIITEFEKNFGEKFLKHINDGTALIQPWSTITEQPMNKINLRNVVNPELKELFDTENSKPFMALKSEPFSVSTGQGSGSGPGETLLSPRSHKSRKGRSRYRWRYVGS
jgi:hypothetical protein